MTKLASYQLNMHTVKTPSSAGVHTSYRGKCYVVPVHHYVGSHEDLSCQQRQFICAHPRAIVNLVGIQKGLKKLWYLCKRNGCSPR